MNIKGTNIDSGKTSFQKYLLSHKIKDQLFFPVCQKIYGFCSALCEFDIFFTFTSTTLETDQKKIMLKQ